MSRPILIALGAAMVVLGGPAAQAGELFPDVDKGLVDFCPAKDEFPAQLASEYIAYNVYELDKVLRREPGHNLLAQEDGAERSSVFSSHRQGLVRDDIDGAIYFAGHLLPRLERRERIDGQTIETLSVTTATPNGRSLNERLTIGFANIVLGGWMTMNTEAATTGPALYAFLEALREADRLAPAATENPPADAIESNELLVALERLEAAYAELRVPMLALVEWPGFGSALEMQTWAACADVGEIDKR